jgi:hypothetical protein
VKLEYRQGYYAPADFKHSTNEDRERQLEEELASDLPATDVAVYLQALYFRVDETHFFVPVSIVVPGSQIPFTKGGDRDKATLDIIGQVKDAAGHDIGDAAPYGQARRRSVATGLAQKHPVHHRIHSAHRQIPPQVRRPRERDRQNGLLRNRHQRPRPAQGPAQAELRCARQPAHAQHKKKDREPPGARWTVELVPNLPHVFRQDQHIYLLYEVYDPAHATAAQAASATAASGATTPAPKPDKNAPQPVRVMTSIEFLSGSAKAFETPLVQATQLNVPTRDAVAFQFDVPLDSLKPGTYICQINVIDDAGGTFTFPRTAVLIRAAPNATPPATPAPSGASGK